MRDSSYLYFPPRKRFSAFAAADGDVPTVKPVMLLRPQAEAVDQYELLIYGNIGDSWFDETVTARDVVDQLKALDPSVKQINVRINSHGGSVSDGLGIYNALRRHESTKVVTIDGVAMSSASLIAMAGDTVNVPEASMLMIHAPWGLAQGNATDMRVMADVLDTYAKAMASAYARKTGKPRADMEALLLDGQDHYYTGADAVAEGFADAIIDALPDPANAADLHPVMSGMDRFLSHAPAQVAAMAMRAAGIHKPSKAAGRKKPSGKTTPADATPAIPATDHPENSMDPEQINAADKTKKAEADARAKALSDAIAQHNDNVKARNESIVAALKPHAGEPDIAELQMQALTDPGMTLDQVNAKALNILGARHAPAGGGSGRIAIGQDAADKFVQGAGAGLAVRAGLAKPDAANEFRGFTLLEMARHAVEASGRGTRALSKMEVVGAAFTSTSDFPEILENTANKAMLKGWDEAPETFQEWASTGQLSDFKPTKRVDLNEFSALGEIPEGAEYQYGTFGERGESVQLATYGKLFAITRQAVINDDVGAFTRIPRKMAMAARRTIGNLVYAVLTGNPVMSDGTVLFHANHNNLLTGAGITSDSVNALRVAMMTQRDPDGNVTALNIPLKYLIVPVALGGAARQVLNSEYEVGASTKNNTVPNIVRGAFTIVEDARLDANSAAVWYGAADGNLFDTIEVSYLDGQQSPYLEQREGWNVDGTEFKVRIDAGVKALDFRTLAKNPGA